MSLSVCAECARHHRETDACPFCGALAREQIPSRVTTSLGSRAAFLLGSVALAAGCQGAAAPAYGGPPPDLGTPPPVAIPNEADAAATKVGPPAPSSSAFTAPSVSASASAAPKIGPEKPPAKATSTVPLGAAPAYGGPPPFR